MTVVSKCQRTHTHTCLESVPKKKVFFILPVFLLSSFLLLHHFLEDVTFQDFRFHMRVSVPFGGLVFCYKTVKTQNFGTEMVECPHDNNGISVSLTSQFSPPSLLLAYEYFTYFLQGQLCILSIFIKLFQPEVPCVLLQICQAYYVTCNIKYYIKLHHRI